MHFTFKVTYPDGKPGPIEHLDLPAMRDELAALSRVIDATAPGEIFTITRTD